MPASLHPVLSILILQQVSFSYTLWFSAPPSCCFLCLHHSFLLKCKEISQDFFSMGLIFRFFPLLVYSIIKICPLCHTHPEHKCLLNLWSSTSFLKIHTSNEEKLSATLWLLPRSHRHEWKSLCNWRIICYSTFLAWLLSICSFTGTVLIYINEYLPNLEVQ